jgi:hypothetical protein
MELIVNPFRASCFKSAEVVACLRWLLILQASSLLRTARNKIEDRLPFASCAGSAHTSISGCYANSFGEPFAIGATSNLASEL